MLKLRLRARSVVPSWLNVSSVSQPTVQALEVRKWENLASSQENEKD